MALIQCGMTVFNELTTIDHRGLHLDLSYNKVLKHKVIEQPSPFNRKLQSNCPTSVRFYKKYLEKKVTKKQFRIKGKCIVKYRPKPKTNSRRE